MNDKTRGRSCATCRDLKVIKTSDHLLDLGPEGGEGGGFLVAFGTPEEVARVDASFTGTYLTRVLAT